MHSLQPSRKSGGNVIAAQLVDTMERDLSDWRSNVAIGDITQVIQWMRKKIYQVGNLYDLPDLINHVLERSYLQSLTSDI